MKTDTTYSPSNFFYTFPLPYDPVKSKHLKLASLAMDLNRTRSDICRKLEIGMTQLFAMLNAPECNEEEAKYLRRSLQHIDQAVLSAYGWDGLDLGHGFHETKQGIRFTISEAARREVLQRLLKLNHQRHAEEVKQGLHDKKKGAGKTVATRGIAARTTSRREATLFDDEGT